jgi:hypothetical protein
MRPSDETQVLYAYFDESYNHRTKERPNEPLVGTVACWLSTAELWKKFEKRWRRALREFDIDHFHMKDYEARQGAYRSWSNPERVERLRKLQRIMKEKTIYGCSISVNRDDYEEKITSLPNLASWSGKTWYAYGVRGCIKQLAVWCDQSSYCHETSICYVFGDGPKQGGELDRLFNEMLNTPVEKKRYRVSGVWIKGIMRETVQLQAADVIAYELNKRAVNTVSGGPQFVRRSLDNLRLSKNFSNAYFDRDSFMRQINSDFTKPLPTIDN